MKVTMTHAERRDRKARIVKSVKAGKDVVAVANKERVTREYAVAICRRAGLCVATRRANSGGRLLGILFALTSGDRQSDIAKKYGVTRQRVHEVARMGKEAGFDLRRKA